MATNFILIGAAGFVAPRHMQAIKDIGGNLVAACDPHDSVGILDSFFPECRYFSQIEELAHFCNKVSTPIHYTVICSPNYLHVGHCDMAMRLGTNVICEKPIVLDEKDLDYLLGVQKATGMKVYPILQLRLHPEVRKLAMGVYDQPPKLLEIEYHSPRGPWYQRSWKQDTYKSGGVVTNIGVHLFDVAIYLFGEAKHIEINEKDNVSVNGNCYFGGTKAYWDLSVSRESDQKRIFNLDGVPMDLSTSFMDLHTECYKQILKNKGFPLESCRGPIRACEQIRNARSTD